MNRSAKLRVVVAGYVTAFLAAGVAMVLRVLLTQGDVANASSGMYAFGDTILFIAVFGVVALVPTGLALYWLRPVRRFWIVMAIAALVLAGTGLAAALVIALASSQPRWVGTAAFAVLRMLCAPLLAPAFLIGAAAAPTRRTRLALILAATVEAAVSLYAAVHWFVWPRLL